MSKCLDPFRFLLISLAGWMKQQWPTSPARSSRVVVTAATLASVMNAATLVSVMNGWHAGAMRRVHDFGVSCVIRGVSGALAGSSSEVSDGDVTLGCPWDSADRVFGPYGIPVRKDTGPWRLTSRVSPGERRRLNDTSGLGRSFCGPQPVRSWFTASGIDHTVLLRPHANSWRAIR